MLGTALKRLRLRISVGRIGRTLILAAAMTGAMALASPLGLIPSAALGVLFYAGGLFALRIVDRDELRTILRRPA
jgi:hypothetical protein